MCDNYKEITIEEMKQIEVNLMKELHSICETNGLFYFLAYGSCIGAVRHKGFIPWDDDIDIAMPYPDYVKLLEILSDRKGRYGIVSMNCNCNYKYPFAKFVDKGTILIEDEVCNSNIGVYIDIFPICGLPSNGIKRKVFFQQSNLTEYCAIVSRKKRISANKMVKRIIQTLLWPISKLIGYKRLNNISLKMMKANDYSKSKYVSVIPPNYDSREIFKKTVFDKRMLTDFEGELFYIPVEYDTYLKQMYGDYMKLPPKEEQVTHHLYKVIANATYYS